MLEPLRRSWRTWAYAAATYAGSERLDRLARRTPGRLLLGAAQKAVAGGSIRIGGGAAGHLRLSTDHLALGHVQGYGLVRGVLEPGVQEALRRHVAPGATVYDVGANLGFFSLLAARLVGEAGRVEAFEPVAANAAAIAANARLNGFANVAVHAVAVADRDGTAELLIARERSWSHLAERGWHALTEERRKVRVVALDSLLEAGEISPPDLVKIDVEGSEGAVLEGMAGILATHRPAVVCELHETNAEVCRALEAAGYTLENLDGWGPVASAGAVHALALPRSGAG